jgi:hypothetical protein
MRKNRPARYDTTGRVLMTFAIALLLMPLTAMNPAD